MVAVRQPAGHIVDQRDPSMAMVIAPLYPDDGLGSTTKIWPQGNLLSVLTPNLEGGPASRVRVRVRGAISV